MSGNKFLVQDLNLENTKDRQFALCETCFWSATIFKSKVKNAIMILNECPMCLNRNRDETYKFSLRLDWR
jgi:hypothetical protein